MLRSHWHALPALLALLGLVAFGAVQESGGDHDKSLFFAQGRPVGAGPFPAIVLLHGCSGITSVQREWARHLNEWGYVTLIVDSFGPRNVRNVCWTAPDGPGNYDDRLLDTRAALQHLRKLSFVDGDRIAVMGWSMGAGVTLRTVTAGPPKEPDGPPQAHYKAAVAFYPPCWPIRRYTTPLLILIGEKDDWTPAVRCERMAAGRRAGAGRVQLVVYPNAYHGFDSRAAVHPYRGHQVGADPEAREDSFERVRSFLEHNL